jgi:hypothetical protein
VFIYIALKKWGRKDCKRNIEIRDQFLNETPTLKTTCTKKVFIKRKKLTIKIRVKDLFGICGLKTLFFGISISIHIVDST